MNNKCIPTTKEIIELERKLPSISKLELMPLIAKWRKTYNRPDDIPSAKELIEFKNSINKKTSKSPIIKVISGGQTGVDTIGLQVARELGIETGGTAPKGFLREKDIDNEDISSYNLVEITDEEQADYTKRKGKRDPYTGRTELNVRNSDGTVYFSTDADSAGLIATERSAKEWNKPFLRNPSAKQLVDWIVKNNIRVLNVAGNRGSKLPENNKVAKIIKEALSYLQSNSTSSRPTETIKEETVQTMSTQEYLDKLNKVATTFTTIEKINRVNLINRLFVNEVQKLLNIEKENLKNRIQLTKNEKEARELSFALENLKEIDIFRKGKSPIEIFKGIKNTIDAVANYDDNQILKLGQQLTSNYFSPRYANAKTDAEREAIKKQWAMAAKLRGDRYRKAFQKMSENFWALAEESTSTFNTTLGCIVDIKRDKISEEVQDADNEPYTNDDIKSEASDNKEEKTKDGWMVDTREVSTFSSLSNRVRKVIGNMPRMKVIKDNGTERMVYEEDDLGNVMYLNSNYVHSQLIQALANMTTATDMIPMLEDLAKKKPWVNYIISELKKDNKLFTAFYRNYRKDYLQYWIQKYKQNVDGSTKIETIGINKAEGTSHYFDDWRDNYEFGNRLDEDSIYNSDGEFIQDNAKIGYDLVQSLTSKTSRKERNELIELSNDEDVIKDLNKLLSMLGISVSKDVLTESLNYQIDNEMYNAPIVDLLSSLYTIYSDMVKGNEKIRDGQPVDFINIYGSQYNKIAEMFNFVEDDAVESSVRQGDKTRYAHVNPSYMTTLIKKLKNNSHEEFIMNEYGKVEWFRNQTTGEWNNEMIKDIKEGMKEKDFLHKHKVCKKTYYNYKNKIL